MRTNLEQIESNTKFYSFAENVKKPCEDTMYFIIFFIFNDKTYLHGVCKSPWDNLNDIPLTRLQAGATEMAVNEVVKNENGEYIHFLTSETVKVSFDCALIIHSFIYKSNEPPIASKLLASLNSEMFIKKSKSKMKERNYESL